MELQSPFRDNTDFQLSPDSMRNVLWLHWLLLPPKMMSPCLQMKTRHLVQKPRVSPLVETKLATSDGFNKII